MLDPFERRVLLLQALVEEQGVPGLADFKNYSFDKTGWSDDALSIFIELACREYWRARLAATGTVEE